jgi:hypothetical protein
VISSLFHKQALESLCRREEIFPFMSCPDNTPKERLPAIIGELCVNPGVILSIIGDDSKKRFGSAGLRINKKIFAMLP